MKKLNPNIFPFTIIGFAVLILFYLISDINNTKKSLAESLLRKPINNVESNLKAFFKPMQSIILSISEQAQLGLFDSITPQFMNRYFGPILSNYPQISSIAIANTEGYEYNVMLSDSIIKNRLLWVDKWGENEHWSTWKNSIESNSCTLIQEWEKPSKNDPRNREWFSNAINAIKGQVSWTNPYVYNTTAEVGLTASTSWSEKGNNKKKIIALDLTLSDITRFTQTLKFSTKGKIFLLTKDGKFIALPKDSNFNSYNDINHALLKSVDSFKSTSISEAYNYWNSNFQLTNSFPFQSQGNNWWGKLTYFELSPKNALIIGVIVPEDDILSEVNQTKKIITGGVLLIILLIGLTLYSKNQTKKMNLLLIEKNNEIYRQNTIIHIKNKEIVDSINYAKRLQKAILPQEHVIKENFANSFIVFKPKDIVSGDFYWIEKKDNWTLFAVADCTGHGVPGAMVSVICKNGLSRSVREYNEVDPGKILNITREIVVQEFEKSTEEVSDGMDIALCAIKNNHLKYAGAYNPLWIIRKGENKIEEYKASKQPIGRFNHSSNFITHEIFLNKGDLFYIFSDGFGDQFGGAKGKKFKTKNFKELLLSLREEDMQTQKMKIEQTFDEWKMDLMQLDDVCIFGVRV